MNKHCIKIDLQNDLELPRIPDLTQMTDWVRASLQQDYEQLEQTIRIVDQAESHQLNKAFRHIDKPTNVLSFPADESDYLEYDHLGDLVICASVVEDEAVQQQKDPVAHWAHMVVHGMLHLQGYDHISDQDAEQMESLEIEILARLGHTNPY
ncbi:MAG: rRNA maturation RNase YbeY [Gammaproteobacteria bacterium]|nr:rRNA maturation RNase YbeY [Gammaproteobacteria bacterium]